MPTRFLSVLCVLFLSILPVSAQQQSQLKTDFNKERTEIVHMLFKAYQITRPVCELTKDLGQAKYATLNPYINRVKFHAKANGVRVDYEWLSASIDAQNNVNYIIYSGYRGKFHTLQELADFYILCSKATDNVIKIHDTYFRIYAGKKLKTLTF